MTEGERPRLLFLLCRLTISDGFPDSGWYYAYSKRTLNENRQQVQNYAACCLERDVIKN